MTDVTQYSQASTGVSPFDVSTYSQAYLREVHPGDIIVKMNNKNISTIEDYNKALKAVAPGEARRKIATRLRPRISRSRSRKSFRRDSAHRLWQSMEE